MARSMIDPSDMCGIETGRGEERTSYQQRQVKRRQCIYGILPWTRRRSGDAWHTDEDYGTERETRKTRTESDSSNDGTKAKAGSKWDRTRPDHVLVLRKEVRQVRLWGIPGESPLEGRQGCAENLKRQGLGAGENRTSRKERKISAKASRRWDCDKFHLVPTLGVPPLMRKSSHVLNFTPPSPSSRIPF